MNETSTAPAAAGPTRAAVLAACALALTLAGPVAYMALLDQVWLRSTGLSALVPMAAGAILGLRACGRDRRLWVRLLGGSAVLVTVLFTLVFFVALRLPTEGALEKLEAAPDVSLPDPQGRPVPLRVAGAKGPTLLVFFRGVW